MNEWKPPCWREGQLLQNPCFNRMAAQVCDGVYTLSHEWYGWKINQRGKLTGPNGVKTNPQHLTMLWKLSNGLVEALAASALYGPTTIEQLGHAMPVNAANDDGPGLSVEFTQAFLPGFE